MSIVSNCPSTCGLCSSTAYMSVSLLDYSSGQSPVYYLDTSLTGVGPFLASPPSAAVTETVCLSSPSCFGVRVTTPPPEHTDYILWTSLKVSDPSSGLVLASSSGSNDWQRFCLADCPPDEAFDVSTGGCRPCEDGAINEGGYCVTCSPGTYLSSSLSPLFVSGGSSSSEESSASFGCVPCPTAAPMSPSGSLSEEACYSVVGAVYVASFNPRIVAYDHGERSFSIVAADDETLKQPWDLEFVSPFLFVETDIVRFQTVALYDVDGTERHQFEVEGVTLTGSLLLLPSDDGTVRLAISDDNRNRIVVVDITHWIDDRGDFRDYKDPPPVEQVDDDDIDDDVDDDDVDDDDDDNNIDVLVPVFSTPEDGTPYPFMMSLGEFDDEVLIGTMLRCVLRRCIATTCDPEARDRLLLEPNVGDEPSSFGVWGLAVIRSEHIYLLSDYDTKSVFKCDLDPDVGSASSSPPTYESACSRFTTELIQPTGIVVDTARRLVYIADFIGNMVSVFMYEGGKHIAQLANKMGDCVSPRGMAIRPGYYAPFSKFGRPEAQDVIEAGRTINMPLFIRDVLNKNVTEATLLSASRFSLSATTEITLPDGVTTSLVTIDGSVVALLTEDLSEDGGTGRIESRIQLNIAGNWTVSVMESGVAVPENFHGSPFVLSVVAAETYLSRCQVKYPSSIPAGEEVKVQAFTFDEFGNPTEFESRRFEVKIGTTEELTEMLLESSFTRTFQRAGSYLVAIKDSKTGYAFGSSPFSVLVVPTEPDALRSTSNLDVVAPMGKVNTIHALDEWKLNVHVVDVFDNMIVAAEGLKLSVYDEKSDATVQYDLVGPFFGVTLSIPKDFEGRKTISFTYYDDHIQGSPKTLTFAPEEEGGIDRKTFYYLFGAGGVALLVGVWVADKVRRYMKKDFVSVSQENKRGLVGAITFGAVDFCIDVFQFRNNLSACSVQKMTVSLAFGAATLVTFIEIGILIVYLGRMVIVGQVYIKDEFATAYSEEMEASEKQKLEDDVRKAKVKKDPRSERTIKNVIAERTSSSVRAVSYGVLSKLSVVQNAANSSKSTIAMLWSGSSAVAELKEMFGKEAEASSFGSSNEFRQLMEQRMEYERELRICLQFANTTVAIFMVAIFEDIPQMIINSYRIWTGCGKPAFSTCDLEENASSSGEPSYLWTTADTAIFFFSLKTAGSLVFKLHRFSLLPGKRKRIKELRRLIEQKTDGMKANRILRSRLARIAKEDHEELRVQSPHSGLGLECAPGSEAQQRNLVGKEGDHLENVDAKTMVAFCKKIIVENVAQEKRLKEFEREKIEREQERANQVGHHSLLEQVRASMHVMQRRGSEVLSLSGREQGRVAPAQKREDNYKKDNENDENEIWSE